MTYGPQKPGTRRGFRPPPPRSFGARGQAWEALRMDGRLEVLRVHPRLHIAALHQARLDNLVSTYQIEGFPVTRPDAEDALGDAPRREPLADDMMGFARRYEAWHADPPRSITLDLIRDAHAGLFSKASLDHGEPGAWKTKENGVYDGERHEWVFHATPPEDTEAELRALLEWYHGEGRELPPAWTAAVFFAEFQAIHPFADGNGRIGRLLNLLVLRQLGHENAFLVPLDAGFLARRETYYTTLRMTNAGRDYTPWVEFYANELLRAYGRALDTADLVRRATEGLRGAARDLLEWAFAHRAETWFKRADYPNEPGHSPSGLTQALAELAEKGYLDAEGERKARRYRLRWERLKP